MHYVAFWPLNLGYYLLNSILVRSGFWQHLREMSTSIKEFEDSLHVFPDEQVQVIFCSLKVNMTCSENIITFKDSSYHLELEDERLEAAKSSGDAF